MPTSRMNRNSTKRVADERRDAMNEQIENAKEITSDVVEYLTDYARENPGHAALACLAVGFVLGWKLKPW